MLHSVLVIISLSFRKFLHTDPGFDRVGKTCSDGSPMTILDIAKQGDKAFEGPVTYSFCTTCEVSEECVCAVYHIVYDIV